MTNILQFPNKKVQEVEPAVPGALPFPDRGKKRAKVKKRRAPKVKASAPPQKVTFGDLLTALSVATFVAKDMEAVDYLLRRLSELAKTKRTSTWLGVEGQQVLCNLKWGASDWNQRSVAAYMRSQEFG